jgi:integrase
MRVVIDMIRYVDDFAASYSRRYSMQVKKRLELFEQYLKKNYKKLDIIQTNYNEILEFLKFIDKKEIKKVSKEKYRTTLNRYFEYIVEMNKKNMILFVNPVPSEISFKFSDIIDRQTIDFTTHYLTYDTILKILRFLFFTDYRMFILVSLLAYTGARISEICSIKLDDIDLENRKFISGRFDDYSKTGLVLYFWPTFFHEEFKRYIELMRSHKYEFVFPHQQTFLHTKTPRKKLREIKEILNILDPINPHSFRDSLNSSRREKGLGEEFAAMLLNQKPNTVNQTHYMKRFYDWHSLRDMYDKSFPYPALII